MASIGIYTVALIGLYRCPMTLDKYLKTMKITSRQFSDLLGVSIFAVRKWRQNVRTPRPEYIRKISALTKRKVKPEDWYAT